MTSPAPQAVPDPAEPERLTGRARELYEGMLADLGTPPHYRVPGFDAMAFVGAVIDRDAGLETPSQAWCRANALKYLIRAPRKGGAEDYRKAMDYMGRIVASMEGRQR